MILTLTPVSDAGPALAFISPEVSQADQQRFAMNCLTALRLEIQRTVDQMKSLEQKSKQQQKVLIGTLVVPTTQLLQEIKDSLFVENSHTISTVSRVNRSGLTADQAFRLLTFGNQQNPNTTIMTNIIGRTKSQQESLWLLTLAKRS